MGRNRIRRIPGDKSGHSQQGGLIPTRYAMNITIPNCSSSKGSDGINGAGEKPAATSSAPIPATTPAWAATISRVTNYVLNDLGGGPRLWKLAWVINFQKLGTLPILAGCIAWSHNTSIAAWIYLAMHGASNLVWLVKAMAFPDRNFQKRITIAAAI